MENEYICESVRLCRYLYSLGFDKESRFKDDGKEYWAFTKDENLQEALSFFFKFRRKMCANAEKQKIVGEDINRKKKQRS